MAFNPRITVLMSVYNGEKFLREAIDSILAQTYKNFEFFIYDDCSTDSSSSIINSYTDDRILFIRNASNQGLTRNLADGVNRARGEYIARMDSDDIALPSRLAKQIAWMDAHPDITILGSRVIYFNENGDIGVTSGPLEDDLIKITLLTSFTLLHPTIMIRVADLRQNGLNYNPAFRYSQDHALYFDCMLKRLKFANYQEPLLRMRSHNGSVSKSRHGLQRECSDCARLNMLSALGVVDMISDFEKKVYDTIASGESFSSVQELHAFDSFVDKICGDQEVKRIVSTEGLRLAFARSLWGMVYSRAGEFCWREMRKAYWKTKLADFYRSYLPLKQKIKYWIKCAVSLVKG